MCAGVDREEGRRSVGRELQASKGEHPGPAWQQFGQKTDSDSGRVLRVMLIGLALGCALGKGKKKESRMNPRFLTKPTRRMKMPFTEMKKLKEAGVGGGGGGAGRTSVLHTSS